MERLDGAFRTVFKVPKAALVKDEARTRIRSRSGRRPVANNPEEFYRDPDGFRRSIQRNADSIVVSESENAPILCTTPTAPQ